MSGFSRVGFDATSRALRFSFGTWSLASESWALACDSRSIACQMAMCASFVFENFRYLFDPFTRPATDTEPQGRHRRRSWDRDWPTPPLGRAAHRRLPRHRVGHEFGSRRTVEFIARRDPAHSVLLSSSKTNSDRPPLRQDDWKLPSFGEKNISTIVFS